MHPKAEDRKYMKMALSLATKGKGMTHPNPMVGAVLVKDGKILGRGYHKGPGKPHAEIETLQQAVEEAYGADLYVTLEPCNHHGRTPPCTEALLGAGIRRVIMATRDPNPSVEGGGEQRMREAGVMTETGLLEDQVWQLNAAYRKYVLTGKPLVTLKVAATADGKVAARGGVSRWITGEKARAAAHTMRRECDAVLVGRGTVEADDPELTVRMVPLRKARPPLRVVVDSGLTINIDSKLAQGGDPQVIVAVTADHDREKANVLRERGVEILVLGDRDGRVDLEELLAALGRMGAAHLLVESGPILTASFLAGGLADRLALFIAPKVFGDQMTRSWVEGRVVTNPSQAISFDWRKAKSLGEDYLLEADISKAVI